MHTFTHQWRRRHPCKATASWSGAVRVRCLAQGHLDYQLGGAGDRTTSNLVVTSQPTLPPELLPPQKRCRAGNNDTSSQLANMRREVKCNPSIYYLARRPLPPMQSHRSEDSSWMVGVLVKGCVGWKPSHETIVNYVVQCGDDIQIKPYIYIKKMKLQFVS